MRVIATAGHVDHGKSTLVKALTGINPDRLREEQEREMTIDLGFAWMALPNGEDVGIIDVPGHIDFIENMLAGVGGIDAALLVIAADEGPMPQTREHLAILELLRVPRAVVALTKTDLAPDEDWLALIEADIAALLAGTGLAGAPIVRVSARKGQGLADLRLRLQAVLATAPPRRDVNKPRLPVDRAFTISGFGTVVTGTLVDGDVAAGDEVVIQPRDIPSRIRGLQTHKHKLERARAGSRVAINLAGVSVDQIRRGDVVARPGALRATSRVDVRLDVLDAQWLGRAGVRAVKHNLALKFFTGAAESVATLRLLEGNELPAGSSGWAQLELEEPVACANGDRFIVRLPSPSITVGGGVVVDTQPARRHRRRAGRADAGVLAHLASMLQGTPQDRILNALRRKGFTPLHDLRRELELADFDQEWEALVGDRAVAASSDVAGLMATWREKLDEAARALAAFHQAQPLADGMPRDTLRSKIGLAPREFNALLGLASPDAQPALGPIVDEGESVRLAAHAVRFSPQQQVALDALVSKMRAAPFNTPLVKDCKAAVGDAVYDVLIRRGRLVQTNDDVVFLRETYDAAVARIRELIARDGSITAAQVRDAFDTSRKYALALLEHLDQIGVTKRVGDARVLKA